MEAKTLFRNEVKSQIIYRKLESNSNSNSLKKIKISGNKSLFKKISDYKIFLIITLKKVPNRKMDAISKLLKPFIGKPLTVIINDEDETLHVFDWAKFEKEHETMIAKTDGMTDAQRNDFLSHNGSDLMDIYDYYMDEDCIEKVENKQWIPFGILGLPNNIDSYAEMDHAGLLLLDVSEDQENPSVVLYLDSEAETIADTFEELEIAEMDEDEDEDDFYEDEDFEDEDFEEEDFEDEDEVDDNVNKY
jgi:hypothetical protein